MTHVTTEPIIRPETDADHDAIDRVVAAAFKSPVEAELVHKIRASPEYVAEMALVAELDGAIVGHVMISGATVRNGFGDSPIAMLSPLAVAPEHHGHGIGSVLVRAVTAIADRRGQPYVILEGSPVYYSRFGFEHSKLYGVDIPLPEWAPAEAAQLLRLSAFDPNDSTRRGQVIYPAAFDGVE